MSFGSHCNAVLDQTLPLEHRASHARSCALHVANKLGLKRSDVLREVASRAGVDLECPEGVEQLVKAFGFLDDRRQGRVRIEGTAGS
jgi:hypothetical protein